MNRGFPVSSVFTVIYSIEQDKILPVCGNKLMINAKSIYH